MWFINLEKELEINDGLKADLITNMLQMLTTTTPPISSVHFGGGLWGILAAPLMIRENSLFYDFTYFRYTL